MNSIAHLIVALNDENKPVAFMGLEERKLEMLFISPQSRGKGLGKQRFALWYGKLFYKQIRVNEQNPQAKGFYEHMGF